MIEISQSSVANNETLVAVNQLLPQLSSSAPPLSLERLNQIIKSNSVHLYIAREEEKVLGMLSLVLFPIPSGLRAWVEDVVVDEKARGRGIGKALSEYALREASSMGAKTVDLTSRPSRVAANQLYQRVGFAKRETNVYRFNHPS
jgi:ribosomal protein S18 acetylase RimI-like enzyme